MNVNTSEPDTKKRSSLVHCHCHTTHSRLDGQGPPKELAARVAELGQSACAITDHGSITGHVQFCKAAKQYGIKPIYGIEAYICDTIKERSSFNDDLGVNAFPHVTILASNQEGYKNLLRLYKISYQEGFYRYPRIDWRLLADYSDGLKILSGCVGGYPTRILMSNGYEAMCEWLQKISNQIHYFYVEINPVPGYDVSEISIPYLIKASAELGIPCVVTSDAHFTRPEDYVVQDLMLAIGTHKKVNDPTRTLKLPDYLYVCGGKDLYQRAKKLVESHPDADFMIEKIKEGIHTTTSIAKECNVELPSASPLHYVGLKPKETAYDHLWNMAVNGLKSKFPGQNDIGLKDYLNRMKREIDVIHSKGACDYLLIVIDIIRHIREIGGVVLTRGSAGGCALLWAAGGSITDPIKHGLSFERFFDATRDDPPDIDCDFPEAYRRLAIEYAKQKYGEANVAQIAAFGTFQARSAVKRTATALGIPVSEAAKITAAMTGDDDNVLSQFESISDQKVRQIIEKYPKIKLADRLVGEIANLGIHAAGLLISPEPLDGLIGIMRGKDGQVVASIDKKDAKYLGHLKIDLLIVDALDVVANILKKIGKTSEWLETIPLNDEKTLRLAKEMKLAGIFQLDGAAARTISHIIGLNGFDDFAIASAICRPGPSSMAPVYAENKNNPEKLEAYLSSMHSVAANIVRNTFGLLIYQEQVMRLAAELALLSPEDVQNLRRGVSDKLGTQSDAEKAKAWRDEWQSKFVGGCVDSGVSKQEAEFWWGQIQTHGGYSFNKSHAVTYALLGYYMLYLKAHYSSVFFDEYLRLTDKPDKKKRLIKEFVDLGGKVLPLDPVLSGIETYSPEPGLIVGGYGDIRGIGEVSASKIVSQGPFNNWDELLNALTPPIRARVVNTRMHMPERNINVQSMCDLAPWVPIARMPKKVVDAVASQGGKKAKDFKDGVEFERGDNTFLAGYIVAKKAGQKSVEFVVEDDTGIVPCRLSKKKLQTLGPFFREIQIADLVAFWGWWNGTEFYLSDKRIIQKANRTK